MNKIIKLFGIVTLSLLFISSCNEFLDEVPDNRTELDTYDKISQLLTSAYPKANYASVANAMADGIGYRRGLSPRAGTNEAIINEDAYYWIDTRSTNDDSPDGVWNRCYAAIAAANHALEAIEKTANPNEHLFQKSEALLCRAFSHFLLVNLYAKTYVPGESNNSPGIPYVDQPETVVMGQYDRKTVAYVYERLQEDIEEALKTVAPESNFKVPAYHFTEKAALTFASRFYIYKGDYNKAVELTSRLVAKPSLLTVNGNVDSTDLASVWAATYFAAYKSNEWGTVAANIRNGFQRASSKHNFLLTETYSLLNRTWTCQYGPLSANMPGTNITGGYWPFTSFYNTGFTDAYYLAKFQEYFFYTTSTTGNAMIMFPYIRAEEVILNRIEANIHLGDTTAAINDFNVYYRQRSGASSTVTSKYNDNTMVLTSTKIKNYWGPEAIADNFLTQYNAFGAANWKDIQIALMLTLLNTRQMEYMHEGMRWFDVLRYKIPIHHTDMNGAMKSLLPTDLRRLWQIPETAKLAGLELNPR